MIVFSFYFSFYRFFDYVLIVERENVDVYCCFFIGVGMIVSKTLRQALVFNKVEVMGYAIDNSIVDFHRCKSLRRLVQDTTDDNCDVSYQTSYWTDASG
jgi:hypothetical protein